MKKILNILFRKIGYIPYDKDKQYLWELLKESIKRDGEMLETDEIKFWRVKISGRAWY